MIGSILLTCSERMEYLGNRLAAEFEGDARKEGIDFTFTPPLRLDLGQEAWLGETQVGELTITIAASAAGTILAEYGVRLIDRCCTLWKPTVPMPRLQVRVIYDGRQKETFPIPLRAKEAKTYLREGTMESERC